MGIQYYFFCILQSKNIKSATNESKLYDKLKSYLPQQIQNAKGTLREVAAQKTNKETSSSAQGITTAKQLLDQVMEMSKNTSRTGIKKNTNQQTTLTSFFSLTKNEVKCENFTNENGDIIKEEPMDISFSSDDNQQQINTDFDTDQIEIVDNFKHEIKCEDNLDMYKEGDDSKPYVNSDPYADSNPYADYIVDARTKKKRVSHENSSTYKIKSNDVKNSESPPYNSSSTSDTIDSNTTGFRKASSLLNSVEEQPPKKRIRVVLETKNKEKHASKDIKFSDIKEEPDLEIVKTEPRDSVEPHKSRSHHHRSKSERSSHSERKSSEKYRLHSSDKSESGRNEKKSCERSDSHCTNFPLLSVKVEPSSSDSNGQMNRCKNSIKNDVAETVKKYLQIYYNDRKMSKDLFRFACRMIVHKILLTPELICKFCNYSI